MTGLTNGTSYTFKVSAANATGTGPDSSPSNAVTPNALPGAPTGVTATAGDASAKVSWTAPTNNGGSTITKYTVTPYIGTTAQTPVTVTGAPAATSTTVTGLTNGTTYTFKVSATNATGTGPDSSPSNAVTPSAPTARGAHGRDRGGGRRLRQGLLDCADGLWRQHHHQVHRDPVYRHDRTDPSYGDRQSAPTSTTVTGLTNGTTYTFKVSATNATGPVLTRQRPAPLPRSRRRR